MAQMVDTKADSTKINKGRLSFKRVPELWRYGSNQKRIKINKNKIEGTATVSDFRIFATSGILVTGKINSIKYHTRLIAF